MPTRPSVQRECAIVVNRITVSMEPVVSSKVVADFILEADLFVEAPCDRLLDQAANVDLARDGRGDEGGAAAFLGQGGASSSVALDRHFHQDLPWMRDLAAGR
jgi:hypothetical protein